MTTEATPGALGSNDQLGLEPAAHVRWHEQNGWDVTEFSGLRGHPEIEAFWGNRQKLALYTADQVRAAVAAERERWRGLVTRSLALCGSVAEQQAMPDDSWEAEAAAILADAERA